MRIAILVGLPAFVLTAACDKLTTPDLPSTYHISATVTSANACKVSVMDKNYSSVGQIRGDVPTRFIGTVANASYHGFGCWVATNDGDGDLIVLFSGNNLGKPLAPGTYPLVHEVYDTTPLGMASVSFRPSSLGGDKLRTFDGAPGNVMVADDGKGGLNIRVEADLLRWGSAF